MNDSSNTLLALLLTLPELDPPLTPSEQKSLKNAGLQLQMDPEDWADIEPDLLNIVREHQTRSQVFAANQEKLKSLDDEAIGRLLPTSEEIELALPSGVKSKKRGVKPTGTPDEEYNTNTLNNLSVRIITNPEPEKAAQKVGLIDKFIARSRCIFVGCLGL